MIKLKPKTKKGSGLVAYSIIIGLVVVLSIYALQNTGNKTSSIFSNTLNTIEDSLNPGPKIGDTRTLNISNGTLTESWNGSIWQPQNISCDTTYHNLNWSCISDTRTISISNGQGTETWNGTDWDLTAVSCDFGYHEESLTCISNSRTVPISNGSQTQSWNGSGWDVSSVSCNSGYTQSGNSCIATTGTWTLVCNSSVGTCTSGYTISSTEPSGQCTNIGQQLGYVVMGPMPPPQFQGPIGSRRYQCQ